MRALRPSLSLTRKSIIQAAIDKADQALQEMASIPEGPAVIEQRTSATVPSQPATPTDTLTAVSSAMPPGRSSGGGAQKRGAEQRIVSPFSEHQQAEKDISGAEDSIGVDNSDCADSKDGVSEQQQRSTMSFPNGSSEATCKPQEKKAAPCSSHPIESTDSVEIVLPGQVVSDGSVSASRWHDSMKEKHAVDGHVNSRPVSTAEPSDSTGCNDVQNCINKPITKEACIGDSSDAVKELLSLKV